MLTSRLVSTNEMATRLKRGGGFPTDTSLVIVGTTHIFLYFLRGSIASWVLHCEGLSDILDISTCEDEFEPARVCYLSTTNAP